MNGLQVREAETLHLSPAHSSDPGVTCQDTGHRKPSWGVYGKPHSREGAGRVPECSETLPMAPDSGTGTDPLVYPSSKEQGFLHLSGPVITVPGRGAEYSALVAARAYDYGEV